MNDRAPGLEGTTGGAPAENSAGPADWVVLARPGPARGPGRASSPRRRVLQVLAAALVVVAVVAVGGLLVSQRIAEGQGYGSAPGPSPLRISRPPAGGCRG